MISNIAFELQIPQNGPHLILEKCLIKILEYQLKSVKFFINYWLYLPWNRFKFYAWRYIKELGSAKFHGN